MSAPKQRFVWACFAGGELRAIFTTEEMAAEFCQMENRAEGAKQDAMREAGFPNYGRTHYHFTKQELRRSLDG